MRVAATCRLAARKIPMPMLACGITRQENACASLQISTKDVSPVRPISGWITSIERRSKRGRYS